MLCRIAHATGASAKMSVRHHRQFVRPRDRTSPHRKGLAPAGILPSGASGFLMAQRSSHHRGSGGWQTLTGQRFLKQTGASSEREFLMRRRPLSLARGNSVIRPDLRQKWKEMLWMTPCTLCERSGLRRGAPLQHDSAIVAVNSVYTQTPVAGSMNAIAILQQLGWLSGEMLLR